MRFWRAYMLAGYQRIAFNILLYSLIFSGVYIVSMNRFQMSLFSTGLLTLTAANSLWFLGGVTGRLWEVGFLLTMAGFLAWRLSPLFSMRTIRFPLVYKAGLYTAALGLIPYFLFHLSKFFEQLNVFFFAFPFLAVTFPEGNLTIKEALRLLLL